MKKHFLILLLLGVILFSFGCERFDDATEKAVNIKNVQRVEQKEIFPEEQKLLTSDKVECFNISKKDIKEVKEEPETVSLESFKSETLNLTAGLTFPECKSRWQFKSSEWYENFRNKVTDLSGISEKNIAIICESSDKEVILGMLNGNVQDTGGVVRYRVKADILEKANITKDVSLHLHQFKGRFENIITMVGGLREQSGCVHSFRLNYDFLSNEIKPLIQCKNCLGEAEHCESL